MTFRELLLSNDVFNIIPWIEDRVVEQHGAWLWQCDAEHRFVHISPHVCLITGRLAEWHLGRTRQELGNISCDAPGAADWMGPLERRERFGPFEFVRPTGDRPVRMWTAGLPITDGLGRFTGYRGIGFAVPLSSDVPLRPHRIAVAIRGEIILPDCAEIASCLTHNISETGACLEIDPTIAVPHAFTLRLPDLSSSHSCVVRWRNAQRLGVHFV